MNKLFWILSAAPLALAGCASTMKAPAPKAADQLSPQQIVAARQAAFHMSGAAMGNMRAALERGDVAGQAYAARGVARWGRVLPSMFPESTAAVTPSRARPEIWRNKADFEAKANAYAEAATRLADAAQSGDKQAFAAQFAATSATCKACHDLYQVPQTPAR